MKYSPEYSSRFRILKGGKISLVVSALLAGSTMSFAAPAGGSVTSGSATINQNGSVTTINQSTNKASINWRDFSIGKTETVNFVQPSAQSVTLNRVVGTTQSLIEGAMNANGQVFLLNPNGVLFANGSQINVGGLVASTLNITDANFQAGNYVFEGTSQNSIINMGTITANNGYVALMGKHVANEGTIVATMGNVQMASGEKISLNLNGNSLVKLTIDQGTVDALVENKGLIKADGGQVYLTTQALNTILDGMVNNTGIIEAQTLNDVTGKVVLFAHGGTANVSGTIDASGGFVETSGKEFTIQPNTTIKAAEWLIDPVNITIDSTLAGSISNALGSGNVTITTQGSNTPSTTSGESGTDGDIVVNSAISWTSANDLTLHADRNININADITATDVAAKLTLEYGQGAVATGNTATYSFGLGSSGFAGKINLQAGQNFSTKLGSDGTITNWTVITALGNAGDETSNPGNSLQGLANSANLSGNFVLGANIDASATIAWNSGTGWKPIGHNSAGFSGKFDGLGHTINQFSINDSSGFDYYGLFGYVTSNGNIKNVRLTNVSVDRGGGSNSLGSLAGRNDGTISNISVTGGHVASSSNYSYVGGLIGENYQGSISNVYASVSVSGRYEVGGLVGENRGGTISSSYATGSVSGLESIGGLVGVNDGTISNSYATGSVTGQQYIGGFAGSVYRGCTISNSYSTGSVIGSVSDIGAFVGYNTGTVTNSFWDTTTSGMLIDGASSGTTGFSTTQMQMTSNFSLWGNNIVADSTLLAGNYPVLRWTTNGRNSGTSVWVIGTGSSNSGSRGSSGSSTPAHPELISEQQVNNIVTTIVNQTTVAPSAPIVVRPIVPKQQVQTQAHNNVLLQTILPQGSASGGSFGLVGTTDGKNTTQTVSMDQLQTAAATQGISEVRVPLGQDSMVDLINGGVNLPKGLSQEFYVIADNTQQDKK